jgi:hypothetical protein
MTNIEELLKILVRERIEFVVIGGLAANIHGVAIPTYDIDICYNRTDENLQRLSVVLHRLHATLRGAPAGLPFQPDAATLKAGLNFPFSTDLGDLDILGEVGGIGFYADVKNCSQEVAMIGTKILVLDLPALIKAKKFAGRKKDQEMILQLEALHEMLQRKEQSRDS